MLVELLIILLALFLLIGVIIWYLGFLLETHQNHRKDRVIYHGSNIREQGEVLKEIISKYIPDTEKYSLIEPGAGLALVSRFLEKEYTWEKIVALDIGWFILLAGRIRLLGKKSTIIFKKANMFEIEFPKPSLVYCYLFPALISKLYSQGKLKGSLVVSLTFQIENLEPTEVYPLKSWQKALYVYDFRENHQGG